ncbi:unnamed protein product [Scytosiphon promiscuus]
MEQQEPRRRRRLCVCTRIHQNNADRPVDLAKVREFLNTVLLYADSVAIAVGSPPPKTGRENGPDPHEEQPPPQPTLMQLISRAAREAESEQARPYIEGEASREGKEGEERTAAIVSVFEVAPWGKFTPALNALVGFAARDGAELVMFQSLETTVGKDTVSSMEVHMEPGDLVVGAALTGHAFQGGQTVELTGVTTPWNTLALWDVTKLAKSGFLGVAEGLLPGVPAGVEEVTAIAALQALLGQENARAKLVRLPQVRWQTAWEDEGRRQWHESKMSSKLERADKQMAALGIKKGTVVHLE